MKKLCECEKMWKNIFAKRKFQEFGKTKNMFKIDKMIR